MIVDTIGGATSFDKENEVSSSTVATVHKNSCDNTIAGQSAGRRTPLSSMQQVNEDEDLSGEADRQQQHHHRPKTPPPRLTVVESSPPTSPSLFNSAVTVQQPPVVYQHCTSTSAVVSKSSTVVAQQVQQPSLSSQQVAYIDDDSSSQTPTAASCNPKINKIVLDANFTPVTPEDTPSRRPLLPQRKFASKSFVTEDVSQLQENIQLNSLIIQKVEEMMTNKNKEYSDQLSVRDDTISALEKEVQKLKDMTLSKNQAKAGTKPSAAPKNSSLTRTYSLRVSKKDQNDINSEKRVGASAASKAKSHVGDGKTQTSKRPAGDSSKSSNVSTLPRSKRTEKSAPAVPSSSTLSRKTNKSDGPKTNVKTLVKSEGPKITKTKSAKSAGVRKTELRNPNKTEKVDRSSSDTNVCSTTVGKESIDHVSELEYKTLLKRLTEEHEKLQVEYARLRLQMVENGSSQKTDEEQNDTASPEAIADPIKENQKLNKSIGGYKQEIVRLQEELRRVQRKYWEQKLGSESIETELQCASKQVVDLIDKVDDAQCELKAEKKKSAEIAAQLSSHAKKNKKLSLDLEESNKQLVTLQHQVANVTDLKQKLSSSIKDIESEGKETQDFLMAERNAAVESLAETESELEMCRADLAKCHHLLGERNEHCRKMTEKLEQKELYNQMLQADLESSQSRARDMLLNQGAEITNASLSLSEICRRLRAVSKSAMSSNNLDDELVKKTMKVNGLDVVATNLNLDIEDLSNGNVPSSNGSSIVQAVLNAADEVNTNNPEPSVQSNDEFVDPSLTRPVGFATPFPSKTFLKPILEEEPLSDGKSDETSETSSSYLNNLEDGTADFVNQISTLSSLVTKFVIITGIIQDNLKNKITIMEHDKRTAEGKLTNEQSERNSKVNELKNKIMKMEMDVMELNERETELNEKKNKFQNLSECQEKTIKNLNKEVQELRMKNGCIESEIKEKRQQLAMALDKINQFISESDSSYPGIQFVSVSEALSEKFSLRTEIARLQGQLSENEKLLDEMASKFTRNKAVLEDNWEKAEVEVRRLENLIDSVLNVLKQIPSTVKDSNLLTQLWSNLSGNEQLDEEQAKIIRNEA